MLPSLSADNQDSSRTERKAPEVEPKKEDDSPQLAFRVGDYERLMGGKEISDCALVRGDRLLIS